MTVWLLCSVIEFRVHHDFLSNFEIAKDKIMKNNVSQSISSVSLKIAIFGLGFAYAASPVKADTASDIAALKVRLKQLEAKIVEQKKEVKKSKNINNTASSDTGKEVPPPVFVDLRKGLFVETEDKKYAFKVGGRLFVDGGGIAGPTGNGWNGNVGISQARFEVEGKMKSWFYKLQYDFANSTTQLWNSNLSNANTTTTSTSLNPVTQGANYVTDRNFLWGGWRDAFVGLQDERISHPLLAQPVFFKIGSQFESFSLEGIHSSKYRETIERPLAVDVMTPGRHLGVAFGLIGKDNWTAHFGVYSISMQDMNSRPVNTSSGNAPGYALAYNGNGVSGANWYQPYGGAPYWETTGRITYAPIFDEHRLVHLGAAGSFHEANNATAYSDDRNSAPGNRLGSEANMLGTAFLGTPDLSCGRQYSLPIAPNGWSSNKSSFNCINNIQKVDIEAALAWHNLFVQGEWLMSVTNRNPFAAQEYAYAQISGANLGGTTWGSAPFISPANSKYVQTGGYVQGEWWITGEEKAQSYDQTDKNGANLAQLKIKDKFSDGGWGAWGLVGRWSVLNLNNGPYQGGKLFQNLQMANQANVLAGTTGTQSVVSSAYLYGLQNQIANSGVYGGYQQNMTAGLNWYPDNGVAFQFNATHVMALKSPLNWAPMASYESGYHPTLIELRTKVYF